MKTKETSSVDTDGSYTLVKWTAKIHFGKLMEVWCPPNGIAGFTQWRMTLQLLILRLLVNLSGRTISSTWVVLLGSTSLTLLVQLDACQEAASPFCFEKVCDQNMALAKRKGFPPPRHATPQLLQRRRKVLKWKQFLTFIWKGLIMSNVKIMTCQAQSNKVPSQRTNAELKM